MMQAPNRAQTGAIVGDGPLASSDQLELGRKLPPPPIRSLESPSAAKEVFDEQTLASLRALRASTASALGGLTGSGPWVLELGCGHGHFLMEFARLNPESRCLGVDFCRDRIRRADRKQSRARLTNLGFLRAEARQFLTVLPLEATFSQVFVLFPDPWPKRRHRKHRLVTTDFLTSVADVSTPAGRFHFRSDAPDYVAEVRILVERHARWKLVPTERLPVETATVFQQRATRFGTIVAEVVS